MSRQRCRELGIVVGQLPTGPLNAITDVAGVRVGHTTLISGEGPLCPGKGPVRTGVTVILPHGANLFRDKVLAAVHTINGYGKAVGFEQIRELGTLESPIALTSTLNVGLVADALVQYAIQQSPEIGVRTGTVNPVVAECFDGSLNDAQGRHVRAEHVFGAIESATAGPVVEGNVGGGTGCFCYGWKGGIGTASRVLAPDSGGFTVGTLVQSNFGRSQDLVVCGRPVGRSLRPPSESEERPREKGSIIMVLATDAPATALQLRRLCVRAGVGLARTGTHHGHASGDFAIAFSTANRIEHSPQATVATLPVLLDNPKVLESLFRAVVEAVEEAILNSLLMAETMTGRDGNVRYAIPVEEIVEA
jgi:D-aminopeptidase